MRRVLLAIGGTIAGLVALLTFKSHTVPSSPSVTANVGSANSLPTASSTGSAGSSPAPRGTSPATPGSGAGSGPTVLTGSAVQTKFGPMQVQVTEVNHKITNITVLQRTDLGARSGQIDAMAIPVLNQETLTAQSASIDAVSGASYTSMGYIQSLQSALDKA